MSDTPPQMDPLQVLDSLIGHLKTCGHPGAAKFSFSVHRDGTVTYTIKAKPDATSARVAQRRP